MCIKFVTTYSMDKISRVEVLRETDKCVYIDCGDDERRVSKTSGFNIYHDSWNNAYLYLMKKAHEKVASTELSFKEATEKRLKVESLSPVFNEKTTISL